MRAARAVGLPGGAVHNGFSINRLGQSARAVGDCQSGRLLFGSSQPRSILNSMRAFAQLSRVDRRQRTIRRLGNLAYLSHGVRLGAMDNSSWRRAVGGISSHNLGGVGDIVPGIGASHEGGGSNDG